MGVLLDGSQWRQDAAEISFTHTHVQVRRTLALVRGQTTYVAQLAQWQLAAQWNFAVSAAGSAESPGQAVPTPELATVWQYTDDIQPAVAEQVPQIQQAREGAVAEAVGRAVEAAEGQEGREQGDFESHSTAATSEDYATEDSAGEHGR